MELLPQMKGNIYKKKSRLFENLIHSPSKPKAFHAVRWATINLCVGAFDRSIGVIRKLNTGPIAHKVTWS